MGRNSKLSEKQWAEVGRRLLEGESARSLAEEFGVSNVAVSKRFRSQHKAIKDVANQLVTAELAFKALPVSSQISSRTIANRLISISDHLCSAAEFGSATAHRLSGIAHSKVQEIDDADPLAEKSMETLKGIAGLTRMANEASEIGVNLLRANKDAVDALNNREMLPAPNDTQTAAKLAAILAAGQRRKDVTAGS